MMVVCAAVFLFITCPIGSSFHYDQKQRGKRLFPYETVKTQAAGFPCA